MNARCKARTMLVLTTLAAAVLLPGAALAQLDQIELALKLRKYYGRGKFIYNSPKFLQNYEDCRARGEGEDFCRTLVGICLAQEQPFFGGPYAGVFRGLGLNQAFKLDCGSGECFQCCHVPGQPCHTSFIGFPVINCNPGYGPGTRPVGVTLVTDPDPMAGEACIAIPQTCEHIPTCALPERRDDIRETLDGGGEHPITLPGAVENRARQFAKQVANKWCGALDRFHTGLPGDPEFPGLEAMVDVQDFLTGRGCVGWRSHIGAAFPFDWLDPAFAIADDEGNPLPTASQRNALCQWGVFRALESVPGLAERLAAVESTVWPDALRDMYLARVDDPDAAFLRHASPVVLDLLRCVPTVYDYRLLAVPVEGEPAAEGVFNGCELGRAPRIFLDAAALGDGRVALDVEVRDPEAGGEFAADIPLTVFWGDGRVSLESVPTGAGVVRFEHVYDAPGPRKIIAMGENTSGLRGFGAVVAAVEGAGAADGPIVVSELRLVDVVVRTETLSGNARTLFVDIEGHDAATDLSYRLGMTAGNGIDLFEDTPLGTWIGHNSGAAPIGRFTLRFHWRDGFYQGLRQVTLRPGAVELHVFDTGTGETRSVPLALGPETVRLYPEGSADPLPPEAMVDEAGEPRLLLHDQGALIERMEIDVPQALLAANAPGPLDEDPGALDEESWFEQRPGAFTAVGRGPDMGPPAPADGGVLEGDLGVGSGDSGAAADDGGEPRGCAIRGPGGAAGPVAGWWLLLLPFARRRRAGVSVAEDRPGAAR